MKPLYMQETAIPMPGRAFRLMPVSPYMPVMGFFDVFEDEQVSFEDARRLQSFYPEIAKKIQQHVEEECDKMEYEGSMMFDEYPDRIMIWKLSDDILARLQSAMNDEDAMELLDTMSSGTVSGEENRNTADEAMPSDSRRVPASPGTEDPDEDRSALRMQAGCKDCHSHRPHRPGHRPPDGRGGLRDFIQVMLLDEMHRRRCRHRRCRRFW